MSTARKATDVASVPVVRRAPISRVTDRATLLDDLPASHERVLRGVILELRRRDPDGDRLARATDPDELARTVADRIVDASALWVEHLGPFYDSAGVAELLARNGEPITKQAVSKRKGLLSLVTGSGQVVFPAFQFQDRRTPPGLGRVLSELPEDLVSRWTLASWLMSPDAELDGERPLDVLRDGGVGDVEAVVIAARRWRAALSE